MSWFEAPEPLLPDLIAAHGKWRGARTALVEGQRRLSWAEFEQATAQVANGLLAQGLERGDRIAVLMDNSVELALLLFGILRSGCVAVPLNVSISDAAVAGMIEDAAARAVFASGVHCARIDSLADRSAQVRAALHIGHLPATSTPWREFGAWRDAQPTSSPAVAIRPDDLCNIIYSSGTTGVPKGIVHSHRCRLSWATDLALALRYRSDCVTLCSLGLFSNISWVAMLATVLVGGTVVLMPAFEARAAAALIEAEGITHGTFVPLQLERLLALDDLERYRLDSLDTIMCCGSPLRLDCEARISATHGLPLHRAVRPDRGHSARYWRPKTLPPRPPSVGKPFLGTDLRILGEDDRELPAGRRARSWGFSPLLMQGYYGREEASREATLDGRARTTLAAHRGSGAARRRRLPVRRGSQERHDSLGRPEHLPADIEQVMREHPAWRTVRCGRGTKPQVGGNTGGDRRAQRPPPDKKDALMTGPMRASAGSNALRTCTGVPRCRATPTARSSSVSCAPNSPVGNTEHELARSHGRRRVLVRELRSPATATAAYIRGPATWRHRWPCACTASRATAATSRTWRRISPAHYRVIVPDIRGRGRSARDPNPNNYQIPVYLRDLDACSRVSAPSASQLSAPPWAAHCHAAGGDAARANLAHRA